MVIYYLLVTCWISFLFVGIFFIQAPQWKRYFNSYYLNPQFFFLTAERILKDERKIAQLSPQGCRFEKLRKVHFLLKSEFLVIGLFVLLEVGYLLTMVVTFVYRWAWHLFSGYYKIMPDWFIFSEYFSIWWFNLIMVT